MHTKESISELLRNSDMAIIRAVVAIAKKQTDAEYNAEMTLENNGVGFSGCHGNIGVSMAKYIQRTGRLTPKQLAYWKVRNKKGKMRIEMYAGQLAKIANGEI